MNRTDRYVKTFFKVMPKRIKQYKKKLRTKKRFDSAITGSRNFLGIKIQDLVNVIGKDHLFRSAEINPQKTLRHFIWKISKSFQFVLEFKPKIESQLSQIVSIHPRTQYSNLYLNDLNEYFQYAFDVIPVLHKNSIILDKLYIQEVKALESRDISKYLQQEKAVTNVLKSLLSNFRTIFSRSIRLGRVLSNVIKSSTDKAQVVLAGNLFIILMITMVYIMFSQGSVFVDIIFSFGISIPIFLLTSIASYVYSKDFAKLTKDIAPEIISLVRIEIEE